MYVLNVYLYIYTNIILRTLFHTHTTRNKTAITCSLYIQLRRYVYMRKYMCVSVCACV